MKNKKASFQEMNSGLISFAAFVLIIVLIILVISVTEKTSMVCQPDNEDDNRTAGFAAGKCWLCSQNMTYYYSVYSTAKGYVTCMNGSTTSGNNTILLYEASNAAYNSTKYMKDASMLPPQFSSLIMIIIVFVGVILLVGGLGYMAYERMNQ